MGRAPTRERNLVMWKQCPRPGRRRCETSEKEILQLARETPSYRVKDLLTRGFGGDPAAGGPYNPARTTTAFRTNRRPPMTPNLDTIRLAVIDTDSGFVKVLTKRLEAAGWQHRVVASAVPPDELVAMKLNALVLDPSVLAGGEGWEYLERVCGMLPDLGVVVCTQQSTL